MSQGMSTEDREAGVCDEKTLPRFCSQIWASLPSPGTREPPNSPLRGAGCAVKGIGAGRILATTTSKPHDFRRVSWPL